MAGRPGTRARNPAARRDMSSRIAAAVLTVVAVLLGGPAVAVPAPAQGPGPSVTRHGGHGLSAEGAATAGVLAQRTQAIGVASGWGEHHTTHTGPGQASAPPAARLPGPGLRTGSAPFASDTPAPLPHHGPNLGRAPPHQQGN